ncbi:MAG: hypothetical protein H8K07_14535 [Nitrospira sp.]|jgi:hypothetical protein|nr:hypothetical protein [Nitrospira sp.]MDI3466114.1 hypothetical protein [Nitrospira sp.]
MKKDGVGKEVMVCEAEDVFSDDRAEGAVMEPNLAGWLTTFPSRREPLEQEHSVAALV